MTQDMNLGDMPATELAPALYMLPVGLSERNVHEVLPARNFEIIGRLRVFIVENVRTARRFLRSCFRDFPIDDCTFHELNGHTDPAAVSGYLDALRRGEPVGVMSEAGCPGVADPGADVVAIAQAEGLRVMPLVGPSSILMSLMASGFNGQGFAFRGYLPIKPDERARAIRELEATASRLGQTQIFIETPYRNDAMMRQLTQVLRPDTLLCVACDITADDESIVTRTVRQWQRALPQIGKRPTIFLIHRPK